MTRKSNTKRSENALNFEEKASKPEKLAKIIYEGIVRYVKAKNARIGEKNTKFVLDSDRKWRVNVHTKEN
ncbi:MAG: hypothetical protein LBP41_02125 [Holosporaceae bacterium]|jgi:flagellar motor component MotA|nr:hypothetical protein [Holosporaceae bacterium]